MSKPKKPRPDKYAEKVKLDISMDKAMQQLAVKANKKIKEKLPPAPKK